MKEGRNACSSRRHGYPKRPQLYLCTDRNMPTSRDKVVAQDLHPFRSTIVVNGHVVPASDHFRYDASGPSVGLPQRVIWFTVDPDDIALGDAASSSLSSSKQRSISLRFRPAPR